MVRKGCEAYLTYVVDTVKTRPNIFDIPTVSDFPDVFPEELPGLPPQREIEVVIDVVPGATPASITPYRTFSNTFHSNHFKYAEAFSFTTVGP